MRKALLQLYSLSYRHVAVSCIKKFKSGNCGAISWIVADFLEKNPEANNIHFRVIRAFSNYANFTFDHQFCLFNVKPDADINKISTYGDNAFIIDPWNTIGDGIGVYPVREILKQQNKNEHQLYTTTLWGKWNAQDFGNLDPDITCTSKAFKKYYEREKKLILKGKNTSCVENKEELSPYA